MLLVSRSDERSVALGRGIAALYATRLPESQASVARAKDENDLLRLMASKQLDLAVLRAGRYAANDGLALRALATLGEHLLVCRDDLPKATAYLLTEILAEGRAELDAALTRDVSHSAKTPSIPLHPGALEYYREHR